MEFKEHCAGRWLKFFVGLFWGLLLPFAYLLMFRKLMQENIAVIVFVTFAMALLLLAAVVLLKSGIEGLLCNGKPHLTLGEDRLQILVNGSKRKKIVYDFSYDQLEKFYFISNGSKLNKDTGKFYVKEGASGSINFNVGKTFYCAAVYRALPAAEYILQRLQDSQIDWTSNELEQDGTHCPKQ